MHREPLLKLLERYLERHPEDRVRVDPVLRFVRAHANCFERTNPEGHITASAWIVSHDRQRFLLTHHRKLGRWLQLGGHADGDPDPLRVALREAREESGMDEFELVQRDSPALPLDVDVHLIPATPREPAHLHHDIRYLLIAAPDQPLVRSDESRALSWFDVRRARELIQEPSMLRMAERAAQWLA